MSSLTTTQIIAPSEPKIPGPYLPNTGGKEVKGTLPLARNPRPRTIPDQQFVIPEGLNDING